LEVEGRKKKIKREIGDGQPNGVQGYGKNLLVCTYTSTKELDDIFRPKCLYHMGVKRQMCAE
jgi:hypothetical protein